MTRKKETPSIRCYPAKGPIGSQFSLSTRAIPCHVRGVRSPSRFMAIEIKPLFNPEILRRRLLAFALPNATRYNETCGQIGCTACDPGQSGRGARGGRKRKSPAVVAKGMPGGAGLSSEPRLRPELMESVSTRSRRIALGANPQPRGTGCVNCARPALWGASLDFRVKRPYPGISPPPGRARGKTSMKPRFRGKFHRSPPPGRAGERH